MPETHGAFMGRELPLVLDGAMGTQLEARGCEMGGKANTTQPEGVFEVHRSYVNAGSDIIFTNTFSMNRLYIDTHSVGVDARQVNLEGVRIARRAADGRALVLGDISSTGQLLEPYGDYTEAQFDKTFREQAGWLAEGGVDGFVIETMLDLREAMCALRACKAEAPNLPALVSLCFHTTEKGGRTVMGNAAAESARTLADEGAAAVGLNCGGLDPREVAQIVALMREVVSLPIIAKPNAGKPELVDGKTVFPTPPGEFAEGILECIRAGASLVGGCCGTSPEFIREIVKKLRITN